MYCDVYSQEYNARASIYKALACISHLVCHLWRNLEHHQPVEHGLVSAATPVQVLERYPVKLFLFTGFLTA